MRKTKPSVLEMVFFENWKHFYKTQNWKRKTKKNKRRDLKGKAKKETPKNRNNWWKEAFQMFFFRETNAKKQGKKEQQKNKEGKNQQENKEETKQQETR